MKMEQIHSQSNWSPILSSEEEKQRCEINPSEWGLLHFNGKKTGQCFNELTSFDRLLQEDTV
jgi:hypothetical protein